MAKYLTVLTVTIQLNWIVTACPFYPVHKLTGKFNNKQLTFKTWNSHLLKKRKKSKFGCSEQWKISRMFQGGWQLKKTPKSFDLIYIHWNKKQCSSQITKNCTPQLNFTAYKTINWNIKWSLCGHRFQFRPYYLQILQLTAQSLFLCRNTICIIFQDACQVIVVGLKVSLPLSTLFFPLLNGHLMDTERHIHTVKLDLWKSLHLGDTDHLLRSRFLHWGNPLFLQVLLNLFFIYGINWNAPPQFLELCKQQKRKFD